MKILKISFQNLNSLKGRHTIDLETGLLAEAGIFAITGPTGAGKSTLLDAITLALFGKAARYGEDANPGDVMTRGEGECMAEVTFACHKGRFTAKWTRHRARSKADGKLQNPKRQIARADDGTLLAEKLRETDALVEDLTGLDYQRFLRSVLLAQGRFKEFLDANENDRGDLLEKITGTRIYSLIGQKAYEVAAAKREKIKLAEQALDGLRLKTPEDLQALRKDEDDCNARLKSLKTRLAEVTKILQRVQRSADLEKEDQRLENDFRQWETRHQAFAPKQARLDAHTATLPFRTALIEIRSLQKQQKALAQEIQTLAGNTRNNQAKARATLAEILRFIEEAKTRHTTALGKTEERQKTLAHTLEELNAWLKEHADDARLSERLPTLQEQGEAARLAHKHLSTQSVGVQKLQAELTKLREQVIKNEKATAEADGAHTQARDQFRSAEKEFAAAAEGKRLADWLYQSERQASRLADAKGLVLLQQTWARTRQTLQALDAKAPEHTKALAEAKATVNTDQTALENETKIFHDKSRLLVQARLIASLEEHRAHLQEGEPCPLCGALEHPYQRNLQIDPGADEKAHREQEKRVEAARKKLEASVKAHTRAETQIRHHEERSAEVKKQLQENADAFLAAAKAIECPHPLEDATALGEWTASLESNLANTKKRTARLSELERLRQEREKALTAAHNKLQIAQAALKTAQDSVDQTQQALATAKTEEASASKEAEKALATFNAALGEVTVPAADAETTRTVTAALAARSKAFADKTTEATKLGQAIDETKRYIADLQRDIAALSEEQGEWMDRQQELDQGETPALILDIPASPAARRALGDSTLRQARESAQSLAGKQKDAQSLAQRIEKSTTTLHEDLSPTPFPDIDALEAAHLDEATHRALTQERDQIKTDHTALQTRRKSIHEEQEKLTQAGLPDAESLEKLNNESTALTSENDALNQRLGEIKNTLAADGKARSEKQRQLDELETLRTDARIWEELNALIGSANGDKFSKFAQGLTLAQLLLLANRHLHNLNERYQILRTDEAGLGLQIVDRYQADALRPTHSLSGGESFLVSLALALGLSDLAGSDTRIESLFIDEGFGTLDAATLDVALAALENLRMANRTIGIISHVETLKQRISAQIQVSKTAEGFGRLDIVNASGF